MSTRVMALVWDSFRPNVDQKLALLALADWCDDQGKCCFSESELAVRTRMDLESVREILASLRTDGTLRPLPRHPGWHQLALNRLASQEGQR